MQKKIRIIGDPVLHQPGIIFPLNPSKEEFLELQRQINLARDVLIETKGAGIAANQYAQIAFPYCFMIVGVFYEIPAHIEGVAQRYPNSPFPQAQIMVNPALKFSSETMQSFNHACLSVPCANRCEVLSPREFIVQYQDLQQSMQVVSKQYKDRYGMN